MVDSQHPLPVEEPSQVLTSTVDVQRVRLGGGGDVPPKVFIPSLHQPHIPVLPPLQTVESLQMKWRHMPGN